MTDKEFRRKFGVDRDFARILIMVHKLPLPPHENPPAKYWEGPTTPTGTGWWTDWFPPERACEGARVGTIEVKHDKG